MIQAVIFDCFGVLTSDAWLPFKDRHFGHDSELFEAASTLSKRSDAGLISYDDFIAGVAELASMTVHEARQNIETNVANQPLFDYIATLKPDYKIGFLSNASANLLQALFTAEQQALFDAVSISYETGFAKPDERAYETIAQKLSVPHEVCLIVDDIERNCTAARDTGMEAVWFRDTEQGIADIRQMLNQ